MNRILQALGNPHKAFKSAHIAGTKGKGSTATMLAEMLRGCDLQVGLYTSPHLLDVRERIAVNSEKISETDFARTVSAVAAAATKAKVPDPTYFEVLTAAAFYHFANEGVEIAVVETGLGGRLDATNVVSPDVVGITSISYDHFAQLGRDLASIATEKAGIIKRGVPVISSPQRPNVKEVLVAAAATAKAPLRFSDEEVDFSYRFEFSRALGRHARICLTTATSRFEHLHVPLLGEHQAVNCGLSLGMLDVLKARGLPIDDQKAMAGLANVKLPGRMQMISDNPRILIDGAHNAASVDALVRAVGQNISYDSMVVVFGCARDKDVSGMVRRIQFGADKIIFTSIPSPRSADPAELAAEFSECSGKMAQVAPTLDDAMRIATSAITRDDLICITGSFYLIAEAMRKYQTKPL
ncbi:MAG: bifunctional folylpolyglutamate synthase/dihydrofolate synthase [Planctomycetes bacterium]|nr:bifunctional folylpolyglutamate synthase/dihydrofolate synthase [Planctomycetota bacterium]